MRKTKIIATLGISNLDIESFKNIDIVRFNFSHGEYKKIEEWLKIVYEAEEKFDKKITILGDTKGPEIRTGAEIKVNKGEIINVTDLKLSKEKEFIETVDKDDIVLIDDGKALFKAISKDKLIALNSSFIKKKKSVIIREKEYPIPSITEQDIKDIDFMKKHDFDVVAQSFVRSKEDVLKMKELSGMYVIAKIETYSGIINLDEIIKHSDGIMVARGDLALSIPEQKLPSLQYHIAKVVKEKPVILATQLLSSMTDSPFPRRAEISDIYNAVINGFDCVMLSEETSAGNYPNETVETLNKILEESEKHQNIERSPIDYKDRIAKSAIDISKTVDAPLIAPTLYGTTPKKLSSFKPRVPIYAISPNKKVLKYLNMFYGVIPVEMEYEPIFNRFDEIKQKLKVDKAIFVFGYPVGNSNTNTIIYI